MCKYRLVSEKPQRASQSEAQWKTAEKREAPIESDSYFDRLPFHKKTLFFSLERNLNCENIRFRVDRKNIVKSFFE